MYGPGSEIDPTHHPSCDYGPLDDSFVLDCENQVDRIIDLRKYPTVSLLIVFSTRTFFLGNPTKVLNETETMTLRQTVRYWVCVSGYSNNSIYGKQEFFSRILLMISSQQE